MPTLALNIDVPTGVSYDAARLKLMVTNYVYHLVTMDNGVKPSHVSGFRKLRGVIKSDVPFEEMRREAIRDKYGV